MLLGLGGVVVEWAFGDRLDFLTGWVGLVRAVLHWAAICLLVRSTGRGANEPSYKVFELGSFT